MALRDDLKNWIAKKVWQNINASKGDVVPAERWNELFNLLIQQGDDTSQTLRDTLDMLYETVLSDDGASHVFVDGDPVKDYIDYKYPYWSVDLGDITLFVGPEEPEGAEVNDIWIDTTQEIE